MSEIKGYTPEEDCNNKAERIQEEWNKVESDTDIALADYNKKRRELFKKGIFEVRKTPIGYFELYVNKRFITSWFPEEIRVARSAISIAYHTYKATECAR